MRWSRKKHERTPAQKIHLKGKHIQLLRCGGEGGAVDYSSSAGSQRRKNCMAHVIKVRTDILKSKKKEE